MIDGAENNFPSYGPDGVRHFEVAPYYTLDGHARVPEVVMISTTTWNRLSPEDQTLLREAAQVGAEVEFEAWAELEETSRQAVIEAGSEIIEVDVDEFQEAIAPVIEEYAAEYGGLVPRITDTQ